MHDALKRESTHSDANGGNQLVVKGKFFLPPTHFFENDLGDLLKSALDKGVGLPADGQGAPEKVWTPALLANELTLIDSKGVGVEADSVRRWLRSGGVRPENIELLARIFGCNDVDKTLEWRLALLSARRRSKKKRINTASRKRQLDAQSLKHSSSLAGISESLFNGRNSLNLPITIWAGATVLTLLTYAAGVHDVVYKPLSGLDKQVGFFWAPNWIFEGFVFVPLFLLYATNTLTFWKNYGRQALIGDAFDANDNWRKKISSFSVAFWGVLIASFLIVGLLQWAGVYLRAYLEGETTNVMIDWITVAFAQPNSVAATPVFLVSIYAFVYAGFLYWFYFSGLLLLYIVGNDFYEISERIEAGREEHPQPATLEVGKVIMRGTFRCAVLGISLGTCIKLNTIYLLSPGENIVIWLAEDALFALGIGGDELARFERTGLSHFTSLALVFLTSFVFFSFWMETYRALERHMTLEYRAILIRMVCIVVLLVTNFLLLGQFRGFSVLLFFCSIITVYGLIWRDSK